MKVEYDLVVKASKGDKDAFSDLYYSCYRDLYKFALYTIGDSELAADAVSDAFVDIWKGIGKLRDAESFASWAFRILSVRCKKEISDMIKRKSIYNFDDLIETPCAGSENIEEDISESASLSSALSKLDGEERMIVVLSVLHGYSNREIAAMIGKPQGTVSSKLHRTYAKLREMLGGENNG
ncbi:MAG: sigma-70 family RNA polymerase sigma factor [Oscillospiraceae bacterium]|nr:sigma-70 family RNA polymerase sigma factor [Oscillospiraceae bacterium]